MIFLKYCIHKPSTQNYGVCGKNIHFSFFDQIKKKINNSFKLEPQVI